MSSPSGYVLSLASPRRPRRISGFGGASGQARSWLPGSQLPWRLVAYLAAGRLMRSKTSCPDRPTSTSRELELVIVCSYPPSGRG